jgi:hypothetical protein
VAGTRVYVEGNMMKLDEWTAQDGTMRHGLSCMSFHARVAQIGGNKPKRDPASGSAAAAFEVNDEIPSAPKWRG